MSLIQIDYRDHIAVLTINRPDALNALNRQVLLDIRAAIQEVTRKGTVRVIIFTGSGPKAFCAGADIAEMRDMSVEQAEEFARLGHATFNAISGSDLVSIAAINGFALGGGCELALSCDIRIAAANAKMGLPEVSLGLIPGFGGTQRLPRLVGRAHAVEIILTGDMVDAQRAENIGLVNRVVEQGKALEAAEELAKKIGTGKGPQAQKMARWMINSGLDLPLSAGLEREINSFGELFTGKETREGMTAFIEKRKPSF